MIKKLPLILMVAAVAFGCSKPAANTGNTSNPGSSKVRGADGKIDKGDRVVIPSGVSKGMFLEAEVVSLDGPRAKVGVIQRNPNGFHTTGSRFEDFELSEIYEVPGKEAKHDVKAGDIVLAKGETSDLLPWHGAEVVKIDNLGVMVKGLGENKQPRTVGPDGLIKPSEKTIAEFRQSGESSMLLSKATKHRPVLVEGYKPKMGDKVLAEPALAGFFHSGAISRMEETMSGGNNVYVKWDDPNTRSTEKVYTILPLASAAKQSAPTVGRYLLVKPTSSGRWLYAEVLAVNGAAAEVKVEDGTTRTVNPGEFWLLEENER
jgi:hypothetical protein